MRKLLVLILMSAMGMVRAQEFEVGVWAGGSNFIGDIGQTDYIAPSEPAAGAIFKWNRSKRHSFRASIIYARLSADDSLSDDVSRVERGLEFGYNMLEAHVGMEYTFWEWDLHSSDPQYAPYILAGITAVRHGALVRDGDELTRDGNEWAIGIPIGLGFKTRLSYRFVLGVEVGARYNFSDNLDRSEAVNDVGQVGFGNTNNDDWYMMTGITLTYTFGRRACYYNF